MNEKITNLADKRQSVFYSVHIEHHWDGTFGLSVDGIGDAPSERSKHSVASALLEAIKLIDSSVLDTTIDSAIIAATENPKCST